MLCTIKASEYPDSAYSTMFTYSNNPFDDYLTDPTITQSSTSNAHSGISDQHLMYMTSMSRYTHNPFEDDITSSAGIPSTNNTYKDSLRAYITVPNGIGLMAVIMLIYMLWAQKAFQQFLILVKNKTSTSA